MVYKMAISEFWYFMIFNPKFSKKVFFEWPQVQNFHNFQKTVLYVKQLACANHSAKFEIDTSIFDAKS